MFRDTNTALVEYQRRDICEMALHRIKKIRGCPVRCDYAIDWHVKTRLEQEIMYTNRGRANMIDVRPVQPRDCDQQYGARVYHSLSNQSVTDTQISDPSYRLIGCPT